LRLSAFFGASVEFWLGLQADYDTAKARETLAATLSRIRLPA
jgi:plasmid maintenance system antidote protein VapI